MEVVVLDVGLREDSPDGVGIRFPVIDVKSVHTQSELFEPLQKGFDVFFVTLFDFLLGNDPTVLILKDENTGRCSQWKQLVKLHFVHFVMTALAPSLRNGQSGVEYVKSAFQADFTYFPSVENKAQSCG